MTRLTGQTNYQTSQGWIYMGALAGSAILCLVALRMGIVPALLFAGIPFVLVCLVLLFKEVNFTFYALFIVNYFIMGINRYYSIKGGMIMTLLVLALFFLVLMQSIYMRLDWNRSKNLVVALWGIWFIYCVGEAFNAYSLFEPWYIAFPQYALFPLIFVVIVPLLLRNYRHVRWLLIIWAILTLIASAKGYWQKNHGFDGTELNWLYNEGKHTHLIYSGIRFFSFFTDAANFGASMGLSLVVFGISGFYVRTPWLKLLFWAAALAGGYGLMISGTRSAIAVPFFGFALYTLLCKNIKAIVISALVLGGVFIFLNFTKIGDGNRLIHRMRSAFDTEDASFLVRTYNKEKIYQYMVDKPFGVGLGLGGGKAKRFLPDAEISQIPTDSWLVQIWVETGIVGLVIYLTIILLILYKGAWIITHEVKSRELKGILLAMLAGICGIFVTSYANEVISFPNNLIIYSLMGIIFAARYYDNELTTNERKA